MIDNREFERRMACARREADRFFAGRSFHHLAPLIRQRVSGTAAGRVSFAANLLRRCGLRAAAGLAVAAAVVVCCRFFPLPQAEQAFPGAVASPALPLYYQEIDLGNDAVQQRLDFYHLGQTPDDRQLLAVVWQANTREPGATEIIYSTLLEGNSQPRPPVFFQLNDSSWKMMLISTWNDDQQSLHYRLLGFDAGQVWRLLEENDLYRGRLALEEGMLVERRWSGQEADNGILPTAQEVTVICPYRVDSDNRVTFAARALRLEVGQYLALVGRDGDSRGAFSVRGFALSPVAGTEDYPESPVDRYRATETGTALLFDGGGESGASGRLTVEVVPPWTGSRGTVLLDP